MTDVNNDQLLDETLDDLADLPVSSPFPAGAHICDMFITRQDKKPSSYIVKFKYKANLEMVNSSQIPPKPGDEAVLFIHTKTKEGKPNEIGQGQLKMILKPLADRLETTSISALIEATKSGVEVGITSGVRKQDGYADQMTLAKLILS